MFEKFVEAQRTTYSEALGELRAGRKTSHWIWWVFPILAGLSLSETSRRYALADPAAARAYLREPLLRARLLEVVSAVHTHALAGAPLVRLMGSTVDAEKLVSSLTLFAAAAEQLATDATVPRDELEALSTRARAVLDEALRQQLPRCAWTEAALAAEQPSFSFQG